MNLTTFLESCNASEDLPFNAVETLEHISSQPSSPIGADHQIRFANSVQAALERDPSWELMHVIR
jgi:hypothetical protein